MNVLSDLFSNNLKAKAFLDCSHDLIPAKILPAFPYCIIRPHGLLLDFFVLCIDQRIRCSVNKNQRDVAQPNIFVDAG